ncbi:MAG: hypothetical protein FH751_02900 [Firmicutes bacterium]|nr:hypothetical protein [Bacillota bacterium]
MYNDEEMRKKEKLKWVEDRIKALEEIEIKLTKMKELTEYVKNNELSKEEITKLNEEIDELSKEISTLDKDSKTFWLDNQ